MAKVTYDPPEGENHTVTWGGKRFERGKAVDIDNPHMLAKAQNNPHFKVSGVSKDEQRRAEVVGGYADANTGEDVELVRRGRQGMAYGAVAGQTGPMPPSAATQGSAATQAAAAGNFEEVYGHTLEEHASGEYDDAPEYVGTPQGTEGVSARRGRPPKKGK